MFTTRTKSTELVLSITVAGALTGLTPAIAQQVTGTPGTPGATTTIDGRYLPPQPFGGEISTNADKSKPFWPELAVPPKDAPNILLIMTPPHPPSAA
jgi:hypothetical protein